MSEMLMKIRISEHPKIPTNTEEFFDIDLSGILIFE